MLLLACSRSAKVGVVRSLLPASLFARIDGPRSQPTDKEDRTLCALLALMPALAVFANGLGSLQTLAHAQQKENSYAPPRTGPPFTLESKSIAKLIVEK